MLIDLHVHTNRYSKCAHMSPASMAATAKAAGLDAVVITEHNAIWNEDELTELQKNNPTLLVMRAFEVSAANKHDVLVYGVTDISGFYAGMPVNEVVDQAHALGGLAVLAHPYRYREELEPEVLASPFDLCEVRSTNIDPYHHAKGSQLAQHMGVPEVYNSDGHHEVSIGGYCNDFHVPVHNVTELVAALRERAFTPLERSELTAPALAARYVRVRDGVLRCINRGITEPEAIWRKVGNSRQLVTEILASLANEVNEPSVARS